MIQHENPSFLTSVIFANKVIFGLDNFYLRFVGLGTWCYKFLRDLLLSRLHMLNQC